jgi:hypothetical protein
MRPPSNLPRGNMEPTRIPRYYEEKGRACDAIMRCTDCLSIVTQKHIKALASCVCGCRRLREITTLSQKEWDNIVAGDIDFPDRDLFMKEFIGVEIES